MSTTAYELFREVQVTNGSASAFSNNCTSFFNDTKELTFAAVAHRSQVITISWDAKLEGMTTNTITAKDPSTGGKPYTVLQCKFCHTDTKNSPLLVICTMGGVMIMDSEGKSTLAWQAIAKPEHGTSVFTKGIASLEHYIVTGCYTGEVFVFSCNDTSVRLKTTLKEHSNAIVDVASDPTDATLITVSQDGVIIAWSAQFKTTQKISTGLAASCCGVVRKAAVVGTLLGQIFMYSMATGETLVEINAHAAPVTAISVAAEVGMFLTCAEDSVARAWKASTRKGADAFEVEQRWCQSITNSALVGISFTKENASGFVTAAYDQPTLYFFKLQKKKE